MRKEFSCMRCRFAVGTTALLLLLLLFVFSLRPTALLGQTAPPGPFGYIGVSDQQKNPPQGLPNGPATATQILQGRVLVASSGCADCHNHGKTDPSDPVWLSGYHVGTPGQPFQIGPFKTYPANLTPDKQTGIGNDSDRQIFNALRYGLDPEDGPDLPITSNVPGQGNFPADPHYLAPPMPWPSFRHKSDADLWAIVAYLKHGIKPIANAVPDSEGPPDHWASSYTADQIGPYPLPPYPAASEAPSP